VIDGSKALAAAIKAVFDKPVIQRCQEHYADLGIMPTWDEEPLVAAG
jgi:transposase-like protein